MFTLDAAFTDCVGKFALHFDTIHDRFAQFSAASEEHVVEPSRDVFARVAQLIESLPEANTSFDYAFGDDGSIGVNIQREDRTEYVDFLSDGRIRYYSEVGGERRGRVISAEAAANFLHTYCSATLRLSFANESRSLLLIGYVGGSTNRVA